MTNTQLNYYTFYLMNGQRKVFMGSSFEDAYLNNQRYKDSQLAIAYQEEGIKLNYTWDSENDGWVPVKPIVLQYDSLSGIDDLQLKIALMLSTNNTVIVEFKNKSQLVIEVSWGHFDFGWTNYIVVQYLEYVKGSYDGTDPEGCHYLITGSEHFSPEYSNTAIECFVKRLFSDLPMGPLNDPNTKSQTLKQIHFHQYPTSMYFKDMDVSEKVWLLGSLIKRLECHPAVSKCVDEDYISRSLCEKHEWLSSMVGQIQCYCDELLISPQGQRNYHVENFITKHFGFKFLVGEQDSCGPLSMIIKTQAGKLVYG